jgi:ribulose-phosphate 3-epimerase
MRAWPTTVEVAPSILSADFGRMREQVTEVLDAGARVVHIDVMDGHFVPVITFGPKMVADIAGVIHERDAFADVHLMIEEPERHIAQFAEAGADSITVHAETCPHLHHTLHQIADLGCRAGVTLNPATPVDAISEAAQYADVLLCMSVNPGWGGQSFIASSPAKIERMRALLGDEPDLEVDGGIDRETAGPCAQAGATLFVAGSAVFGAPDPGVAFREIAIAAGCG